MKHPYIGKPSYTKWKHAISKVPLNDIDPVVAFPQKVKRSDLVATAGSCFAQHISRALVSSGFNYYQVEKPHPFIDDLSNSMGYIYSARYGNIYTSRQLLQLIERAFKIYSPPYEYWENNGNIVDPFRPTIQPGGYISRDELILDQENHLRSVREMVLNMNFLIFTLGLSECWINIDSGVVYPVCPGVAGGKYDPSIHKIVNLTVDDIVQDIEELINIFNKFNPKASIILTVSPVALAATALDKHVLLANTYSKSVLRVAADILVNKHSRISYFPSYEIILGQHTRGQYLSDDCREVTKHGVERVMALFEYHVLCPDSITSLHETPHKKITKYDKDILHMIKAQCDEERYGI
jgi:hypothetical protein